MDGEEREKRLILINVCELNLTKLEKIVIIVASINDWYEIALCVSTSTQQQQQQQQRTIDVSYAPQLMMINSE